MESKTRVFVYGTLKSDQRSNSLLRDSKGLSKGITRDTFRVFSSGFPMAVFDPSGHPLAGEVYEVSSDVLKDLDFYEGYPDFYDKREIDVNTPSGPVQAFMYFLGSRYLEDLQSSSARLLEPNNGILEWKGN